MGTDYKTANDTSGVFIKDIAKAFIETVPHDEHADCLGALVNILITESERETSNIEKELENLTENLKEKIRKNRMYEERLKYFVLG
ncbi:MAG: hypothetical protein SFU21_09930 [Flavihumibacter sp.]|nr:hypothetical protein [Flavihumibacter sp.]